MRLLLPFLTRLTRTLPTVRGAASLALALLALGGLTILPLHAQWAVVDVDAIAGITKEVSQGAQQIQQLQQQYDQMKAMAIQAQGMFRFQGPQNIWQDFQYADQYGTLAQWGVGLNSGNPSAVQNAYAQNTTLATVDNSLAGLNAGLASFRRSLYSAQQVIDGNNMAAMSSVGQIHAAAAQYRNAISALENDDESDDPDLQSQLAVEERTSNAAVLQLRSQQDTNQLLSDMLQQQLAQNLVTRGAIVEGTNNDLDYLQSLQTNSDLTSTYGQSLQNWSISNSQ